MRNLKRALSLTLASVMLFGMMVVGTSAASYPDVSESDNVEAIEVLKAVGVMVGDEKGNFGPDQPVNRAQMAVVMALLLNLDYNYYEGTNHFVDVPAWAEPYVAACYANGIVSGYDAYTYGSGDSVTAVQAASMMMRALGYFQYQSDYDDNGGFELATVKQASKIDLFKDINANAKDPLTRNQVAKLALNTLESDMVDAQDNTLHITTGENAGNINITGGQITYVVRTSASDFAKAIDSNDYEGNSTDGRQGSIIQMGEQLYQGDLKLSDDETDDFGRPSRSWRYKTEDVGTYAKKSELVQTWTEKVTKNMVYAALGKNNVDNLKHSGSGAPLLNYWVDGNNVGQDLHNAADIEKFADRNNTGDLKMNDADPSDTGNGTRTELYLDKDGNVNIVVMNTYVFQAASDYSTSKDELRVSAAGDTSDFIRLNNYTLKGEDFDLEDVKEDDYLLLTVAYDGSKYVPQTVEPAELITGAVTAYSTESSVTVDGEKYSYATKTNKGGGVKSAVTSTGGSVALVMDKYGFIIAVDDTIVGGNYVFITEADNEGMLSSSNVIAKAYFSDGTEDTITLKKVDGSTNKTSMKTAAGWYSYSKDSAGKYTLTSPRGSYESGYNLKADAANPDLDSDKLLVSGKAKLFEIKGTTGTEANGASNVRANERTIFVIVDKDGDVAAATGISEAPDVEITGGNYQIGYVWNDKTEYATFVFIGLENNESSSVTANESNEFIYVLEEDGAHDDGNNTYYTFKTIRDGAQAIAEMEDNGYDEWTLYTKVKTSGDNDRITAMKEVVNGSAVGGQTSDKKWHVVDVSDAKVSFEKNVLTIGDQSYTVNNDTQLHMVVDKDIGIDASDKINTDKDADYVVYDDVNGAEMRATLDGCAISGKYYVVLEKDWAPGNNGALDYLFLHVTGASDSAAKDEDKAQEDLEELDDTEIPNDVIPKDATETEAKNAIKKYLENEIKKAAKNVDYKVDFANAEYGAPTAGTAENPAGTPGTYGPVKVTIETEDEDTPDIEVTLSFTIAAAEYEFSVEDVGGELEDIEDALFDDENLPGEYEDSDAGKLAMKNDIADRYAAKAEAALSEGITPAAATSSEDQEAIDKAELRILSNGMRLVFTWGEVRVPTAPTVDTEGDDGNAVITKLELKSADGKTSVEVGSSITVTVPAQEYDGPVVTSVEKYGSWISEITGEVDGTDNKKITITVSNSWTPNAETNADMIGGAGSNDSGGGAASDSMYVGVKINITPDATAQKGDYNFKVDGMENAQAFADGAPADGYLIIWVSVAEKSGDTWSAAVDATEGDVMTISKGDTVLGTITIVIPEISQG